MKPTITIIDKDWLTKNLPCQEALDWYGDYLDKSPIEILNRLIEAKKYVWANWFVARVMTYHDYVSYAVFAAEQVIDIYEKKYPDDNRPRKAIEAAKKCIVDPSDENKAEAAEAAGAAWAAAGATWAAAGAARAAAEAAGAVETAEATAKTALQLKILNYGLKLLEET